MSEAETEPAEAVDMISAPRMAREQVVKKLKTQLLEQREETTANVRSLSNEFRVERTGRKGAVASERRGPRREGPS